MQKLVILVGWKMMRQMMVAFYKKEIPGQKCQKNKTIACDGQGK
jgi:hypothetical protein